MAVESPLSATGLPDSLAADAVAVLQVNDPQWLVDRVDQLATAAGAAHEHYATLLDELLFFSSTRGGVDLERPLMIGWRRGDAPLIAAIPVADRERFLRDFGTARYSDRLLVRINEMEGTLVLGHNSAAGLFQYRLLLGDGYAFLARTAEECRALAAQPPMYDESAVPLRMRLVGDAVPGFLATLGVTPGAFVGGQNDPRQHIFPLLAVLSSSWQGIVAQVAQADITIGPGSQEREIACDIRITGQSETRLSAWIARQTNASSRLIGAVASEQDVAVMHGNIRWQGELESWGRNLLRSAAAAGTQVDPDDIQAVRDLYRLWDRQGAFASAVTLKPGGGTAWHTSVRQVSEQPGSADILTYQRRHDRLFELDGTGESGSFGAFEGQVSWQGEFVPTGPETDTQPAAEVDPEADSQPEIQAWHRVQIATVSHLIEAIGPSADEVVVGARTVLVGLDEMGGLQGANGIAAARIHIDRILEYLATEPGQQLPDASALAVDLVARSGSQRSLDLHLDLPFDGLVELVTETAPWFVEEEETPARR